MTVSKERRAFHWLLSSLRFSSPDTDLGLLDVEQRLTTIQLFISPSLGFIRRRPKASPRTRRTSIRIGRQRIRSNLVGQEKLRLHPYRTLT